MPQLGWERISMTKPVADVGGIAEQSWPSQVRELEYRLSSSKARWKIVVGHHPVRNNRMAPIPRLMQVAQTQRRRLIGEVHVAVLVSLCRSYACCHPLKLHQKHCHFFHAMHKFNTYEAQTVSIRAAIATHRALTVA